MPTMHTSICELPSCEEERVMPVGEYRYARKKGRKVFCSRSCSAKYKALVHAPENPARGTMLGRAHRAAESYWPKPWTCAYCREAEATDVHHQDRDRENNAPENLVLLCRSCHVTLHNHERETGKGTWYA